MAMTELDAIKLKLENAGVTLTEIECKLLISDLPVSLSLKYGRSSVAIPKIQRSSTTIDFIMEQARNKWEDLKDMDLSLYSDKDCKHEIDDPYLKACSYPLVVYLKTNQKGFSDFTQNEALKYAGVQTICTVAQSAFPGPVAIDEDSSLLKHTIEDLKIRHKLYDPLEEGCEYTRREFISPILILAATIAEVKLACEEQVEGSAGKGPVDWVAHYQDHRICITEGKKDNITQGLYQNLAQLTAAGEGRGEKRKFCVDLPLYGIATTYREWIFLRLDPSSKGDKRSAVRLPTDLIVGPDSPFYKQTVIEVASRLAGLLLSQQTLVDGASGTVAKRTKS